MNLLVVGIIVAIGFTTAIVLFVIFNMQEQSSTQIPIQTTWIEIPNRQCFTNPWDLDWLKSHGNDEYALRDQNRTQVIESYYESRGVEVFSMERVPYPYGCYTGCGIPCGTLHLQVRSSDIETMLQLGFTVSANQTMP